MVQMVENEPEIYIRVAGIVNDSVTDGPGLRFTLFVQGCPRRCEECHNVSAQPFTGGTLMTVEEIMEKIKRNPLLSGVTFSGGEPFSQAQALLSLAKLIKEYGLELAAYSGYLFEELIEMTKARALLEYIDVLVDGEFVRAKRNLNNKFKGSENQRIINVSQSLRENQVLLETSERWV